MTQRTMPVARLIVLILVLSFSCGAIRTHSESLPGPDFRDPRVWQFTSAELITRQQGFWFCSVGMLYRFFTVGEQDPPLEGVEFTPAGSLAAVLKRWGPESAPSFTHHAILVHGAWDVREGLSIEPRFSLVKGSPRSPYIQLGLLLKKSDKRPYVSVMFPGVCFRTASPPALPAPAAPEPIPNFSAPRRYRAT